jgi:hypothetical protein
MDRLKLETVYLRALDALMSADEYRIQAAIFRLRRGSVPGRGVISAESAVEKRADPGVELGWSPRQAV